MSYDPTEKLFPRIQNLYDTLQAADEACNLLTEEINNRLEAADHTQPTSESPGLVLSLVLGSAVAVFQVSVGAMVGALEGTMGTPEA